MSADISVTGAALHGVKLSFDFQHKREFSLIAFYWITVLYDMTLKFIFFVVVNLQNLWATQFQFDDH